MTVANGPLAGSEVRSEVADEEAALGPEERDYLSLSLSLSLSLRPTLTQTLTQTLTLTRSVTTTWIA